MIMFCLLSLAYGKFFIVSDIHLDLWYSPNSNYTTLCHKVSEEDTGSDSHQSQDNFYQFYCDSSYSLLISVLEKMQQVDKSPEFILITGDLVAHSTMKMTIDGKFDKEKNKERVHETLNNITKTFRNFFLETQIIPVIGNNDAYDHYDMPTGYFKHEYLNFVYKLWNEEEDIPNSFLTDGYYTIKTYLGHTIICLNTLLFSSRQKIKLRSWIQLIWLKSQLEVNEKVFIAFHIPPGFSLYSGGSQSWHDAFVNNFRDIVEMYSSKILGIFGGHYHNSYFALISGKAIMINPSVSPLFGNNPGFRYFDYENKDFVDFALNFYDLGKGWSEVSFKGRFGYELNYLKVFNDIKEDVIDLDDYVKSVTGHTFTNQSNYETACIAVFGKICNKSKSFLTELALCAFSKLRSDEFLNCVNSIVTFS